MCDPGELLITQRDRDRLVVLKKAQNRGITQPQAAAELRVTVRQVKRLLVKLKGVGTGRWCTDCVGGRPTAS